MAELKRVYLIWGEDEVKLDAWRKRVRARAAAEGAEATLEVLKDERLSPDAAIEAIGALTLSLGRRYLLVDGLQRWSDRDLAKVADALAGQPPDTVLVMIAGSKKEPARLADAVRTAGGEVHACAPPGPKKYPDWISERARDLELSIDREAAETLLSLIGPNQQRLMRELEKLALYAGDDRRLSAEDIEAVTRSSVEARTYELADALIAGERANALRIAEELRAQDEDTMHILFALLRQIKNVQKTWAMLAAGKPVSAIQSALRVPNFIARRLIAQAQQVDGERLEETLALLADLDYAIRGAGRLHPESSLTLTIAHASTGRGPVAVKT